HGGIGHAHGRHAFGDEAGEPFGDAHPYAADRIGAKADRRGQDERHAIRFEQVDRADIGGEPPLNEVHDVGERFGRVSAARNQQADLFERPEPRVLVGGRGRIVVDHVASEGSKRTPEQERCPRARRICRTNGGVMRRPRYVFVSASRRRHNHEGFGTRLPRVDEAPGGNSRAKTRCARRVEWLTRCTVACAHRRDPCILRPLLATSRTETARNLLERTQMSSHRRRRRRLRPASCLPTTCWTAPTTRCSPPRVSRGLTARRSSKTCWPPRCRNCGSIRPKPTRRCSRRASRSRSTATRRERSRYFPTTCCRASSRRPSGRRSSAG